jgi:SulP family sulfate permease
VVGVPGPAPLPRCNRPPDHLTFGGFARGRLPDDGSVRLPLFTSLRGYRRASLRADLTAGLLIVAIAIPLSMGMAEVAGMPPIAGLYACVLPLLAYAALGSSRQLVIALDASTAMIVAVTVAPLAGGDPMRYVALVGGLTILAGVILLVAAQRAWV